MDEIPFGHRSATNADNVASLRMAALRDALPRRRRQIFWTFQVAFWLAIAAAVLGFNSAVRPGEPVPWLPLALRTGTGFAISSLLYLLFETPRLRGLPRAMRWPLMAGGAVASLYASVLLFIACGVGGPSDWTGEKTLGPIVTRLVAVGFWCVIVFGLEMIGNLYQTEILLAESHATAIDVELRMLMAEAASRKFELRELQAQMNPHFLFNALNAVVARKHDPEGVETVTRDLAEYLRFALGEARTLEPLSRELQALEKYLAVQQARFGENLVCRITCDIAAYSALVPPMLIQPLLENALHYGAQTSRMPLRVEITAKVGKGVLEVAVANSGRWVPPDKTRSPSTGIRSLRKLLALLVDEDATVDTVIDPDLDGGWVRVVIRMPATLVQPSRSAPAPVAEPI